MHVCVRVSVCEHFKNLIGLAFPRRFKRTVVFDFLSAVVTVHGETVVQMYL